MTLADHKGWLIIDGGDDLHAYHGRSFRVVNVVSGDVIEIEAQDVLYDRPTTLIRLWGVRAPRPPRPGREPEPLWDLALDDVCSLVLQQEVTLVLESHRTRDPQGHVLAHVVIARGGTLSERLLERGLARRDERWPHASLTPYAQAEHRARRGSRGIWSSR